MNTQHCKVGKTKSRFNASLSKKRLQAMYHVFMEQAYNISQVDASLSDCLYHEASLLKRLIRR